MAVYFHEEDGRAPIRQRQLTRRWIGKIITAHQRKIGTINIILTSDHSLREMNQQFFAKEDLTDVISFDLSSEGRLNGDVYISEERVRENAAIYNVSFEGELRRVIAHGILHLVGYADGTEAEQAAMRNKEEEALKQFREMEK